MAQIAIAKISKQGNKFVVIQPGAQVAEFKTFEEADKECDARNAEVLESVGGGSVTDETRFALTYRNQFQVKPKGESNAALTVTQDVMDAIISDWETIKATYQANRPQVAPTYAAMPKSVGREQARTMPKRSLAAVKPTPATV